MTNDGFIAAFLIAGIGFCLCFSLAVLRGDILGKRDVLAVSAIYLALGWAAVMGVIVVAWFFAWALL